MLKHVWVVRSENPDGLKALCEDSDRVILSRVGFFNRLRLEALRFHSSAVADELATIIASTKIAIRESDPSLHQAFRHASALSLLHEGGVWINDNEALSRRFFRLAKIEQELLSKSHFGPQTLLLLALKSLNEKETLPKIFKGVDEVEFDSIADFTPCELQIIFRLAALGLQIRFRLLFDRKARGLLLPVQALLNEIEAVAATLPISVELADICAPRPISNFFESIFDEGATPQSDPNVEVVLATHFRTQVDWVCEKIRFLKSHSAEPISIGVALRSWDERLSWLEDGLRRHKLEYKLNGYLPLRELPQAKVLLREIRAANDDRAADQKSTFSEFLQKARELSSDENLAILFGYIASELSLENVEFSTRSLTLWLERLLERREVNFTASSDADAIAVLSIKQLQTRKFDYLFIVDMAQGRFPKTEFADNAFSNEDRIAVNKIFGRSVLPVLFDDPLETSLVPSRQAFEALWFAHAMMSAQAGLYLSSSSLDPSQREQAPSEFLIAAMKVVMPTLYRASKMLGGRENKVESLHAPFQLEPELSRSVLKRWLGLDSTHPITPTRLEAFANCPFRGLVQNIFGIDDPNRPENDLDARQVGRFVHAVLEQFFREAKGQENSDGLGNELRTQIARIISQKKSLLEEEGNEIEPSLIRANLLWLSLVLERAISNHLNDPPLLGVAPSLFEHRIGFDSPKLKFTVGENDIFFGGILDRVDEGKDALVVVDYKMSSAMTLRQKMITSEILKTQFQLPLYMRLLLEETDKKNAKPVFGYLISVRDGVSTKILGKDLFPELGALIRDDEREDGLASAIKGVMAPILSGYFTAKRNASCDYCHLKSVCRIRDDQLDESCDE